MDLQSVAVPDSGNFEFGDKPIPDNFLDDSLGKALSQHTRKESQIESLSHDFASILEQNTASKIAANLIGYIGTEDHPTPSGPPQSTIQQQPRDPDEDDVRVGHDEDTNADEYGLDEMLIETVTHHKHRESRTDFVKQKLPMVIGSAVTADGDTFSGDKIDLSGIASNLVAFLHDDHGSKPQTPQFPADEEVTLETAEMNKNTSYKKARGSTDLTELQTEIDKLQRTVQTLKSQLQSKDNKNMELNQRVTELEGKNHDLVKELRLLQDSKTTLAINSTKCIDDMREILLKYQKQLKLTHD